MIAIISKEHYDQAVAAGEIPGCRDVWHGFEVEVAESDPCNH